MTTPNPLLDFSGLTRFDAVRPEHVAPAIDALIAAAAAVVKNLETPTDQVTWDNFVVPLEEASERLGRAWGVVNHLNSVMDTPELRAVYNDTQPKITEFWTALGQNEARLQRSFYGPASGWRNRVPRASPCTCRTALRSGPVRSRIW